LPYGAGHRSGLCRAGNSLRDDSLETNIERYFRVRIGSYAFEERAELVANKLMQGCLEPIILRKA
jgi:hypothetical protein